MDKVNLLMKSRKGWTLMASMILLIAMSLLGVVAVDMAVQEVKIAQNYQSSQETLAWAEAGIEAARQVLIDTETPEMFGYECDPANPDTVHFYPDASNPRVRYCIKLIKLEQEPDSDNRGSGQDPAKGTKTFFYKLDATVFKTTSGGEQITLREIQTMEQQTRYSI